MAKDDVFQMVQNAQNHIARSKEGWELIRQGKPPILSIEPVGFEPTKLIERRELVVDYIKSAKHKALKAELKGLEAEIIRRESTEIVGTSELNWRRNMILIHLNKQ